MQTLMPIPQPLCANKPLAELEDNELGAAYLSSFPLHTDRMFAGFKLIGASSDQVRDLLAARREEIGFVEPRAESPRG